MIYHPINQSRTRRMETKTGVGIYCPGFFRRLRRFMTVPAPASPRPPVAPTHKGTEVRAPAIGSPRGGSWVSFSLFVELDLVSLLLLSELLGGFLPSI